MDRDLHDWFDTAADARLLRAWHRGGALPPASARTPAPAAGQWRALLDRLALWLGTALCAAALICFIAANWEHLGKMARLYGMQAVLLATTLGALWLGLRRAGGLALLWLSMLMLGGLLALIGQTYQTGADTWELFALWAALALPWAVAARHAVHWLTWAAILNIAWSLWLQESARSWGLWRGDEPLLLIGLLNLALLALWELAGRCWPECGGAVGRRLLALAAMLPLTLLAMSHVSDPGSARWAGVPPMYGVPCWAFATAALGLYGLRVRRDLPVLALLALGIIGVVSTALHEWLLAPLGDTAGLLLIAVAVVAQATAAGFLLRSWGHEEADA